MSVFKKYDYWSILESLDTMTEYDYNGNVNDSIYYDFYQDKHIFSLTSFMGLFVNKMCNPY